MMAWNDCQADTITYTLPNVGINDLLDLGSLEIYLNPSRKSVHLHLRSDLGVEFLNMNGQAVHIQHLAGSQGVFSERWTFRDLSSGCIWSKFRGKFENQMLSFNQDIFLYLSIFQRL
ncbi:MAG: hypothetical protein AAF587_38940 [Bacteroidota bacterium]